MQEADAGEIVAWTAGAVDRLAVATSFQSSGLVLLHMLQALRPDVPVLFLDTGFHFRRDACLQERIVSMWELALVELRDADGASSSAARAGLRLDRMPALLRARSERTARKGRSGRWEGFDKTECGIHSFGRTSRQSEAEQ